MKITMSQLDRVANCPASVSLPQIQSTSAMARRGKILHQYLEDCAEVGPDKAIEQVPADFLDECGAIDLEKIPLFGRPDKRAEVPVALNMITGEGRELAARRSALVDLKPGEIMGVADVVAVDAGDIAHILDYKTGASIGTPRDSRQLQALALAFARACGCSRASISVVYIRGSMMFSESCTLDEFDLDLISVQMKAIYQSAGNDDLISEGPWCAYCPAFAHCPAKKTLALELATNDLNGTKEHGLTRTNAGNVWERIKLARQFLHRLQWQIEEYAREEPIFLPNGKTLGLVRKAGRASIDGPIGYDAVKRLAGDEVAALSYEPKVTKTRIKEALRTCKVKGRGKMEERIYEEIEERGGMIRKTIEKIEEH